MWTVDTIRIPTLGEYISVLILITNMCMSIDLKYLYAIRVRLIFMNFRFI